MSKLHHSFKRMLLAVAAMTLMAGTLPAAADVLGTTGYKAGSQSFGLSLNGNASSPGAGGFAGTWNSGAIVFWCIELTQFFSFGGSYSDYVASAQDNPTFTMLGQLFHEAYGVATSDAQHSAAFQLAIWEIVYDPDLDLHAGAFHVTSGDAATIALAQGWLSALGNFTDNYDLVLLHSPTHQDFITFGRPFSNIRFTVPEPPPLALFAIALLGLLVAGRGRRATAQDRRDA